VEAVLRWRRLENCYSPRSVSRRCPGTQQYVSDLKCGLRNPTIVTLHHIASALGVSHVDLVLPEDDVRREDAKPPKRKSGKN